MTLLGITGNMGSGKSVVSKILQLMNIPVYNADERSKYLCNHDCQLQQQLQQTFGNNIYQNGKLDRKAMSSIIFSNSLMLQKANALIHPYVKLDFENWLTCQQSDIAAMESAIIYEAGFETLFHYIVAVISPHSMRVERVMKRNNMGRDAVEERLKYQSDGRQLAEKADFVVINDEKKALILQIHKLLVDLRNKNNSFKDEE